MIKIRTFVTFGTENSCHLVRGMKKEQRHFPVLRNIILKQNYIVMFLSFPPQEIRGWNYEN